MKNDEADIRALFQAWRAAVEGADVPTLLDLVTEDALFLAPGAPPLQGKAAVEAVYHRTFAAYRVTQDFEEQELLLFGDWALVRGVERGSVHPLDGAEAIAVPPRRAVCILARGADGKWRFARGISNEGPPVPGG